MFKIGKCSICGGGACWIPDYDGELYELRVCSENCLEIAKAKAEEKP